MKSNWIKNIFLKTKEFYKNITPTQKRNIIVVIVLGFIFFNSLLSSSLSFSISELPKKILYIFTSYGKHPWLDNFVINEIRHFAHFVEYFVFGLLISKYYFFKNKSIPRLVNSAYLVLSIAFLDETIQIISGRNARISDVWIDLFGGIIGLIVYFLFRFYKYSKHNKS